MNLKDAVGAKEARHKEHTLRSGEVQEQGTLEVNIVVTPGGGAQQ